MARYYHSHHDYLLHGMLRCVQCGRWGADRLCAGCGLMAYCSEHCARTHWTQEHHADHAVEQRRLSIGEPYGIEEETQAQRDAMDATFVMQMHRYGTSGEWKLQQALGILDPAALIAMHRYFTSSTRDVERTSMRDADRTRLDNGRRFLGEAFLVTPEQRETFFRESRLLSQNTRTTLETDAVLFQDDPARRMSTMAWATNPDMLSVDQVLRLYQRLVRAQPEGKGALRALLRDFITTETWPDDEEGKPVKSRKLARQMLGSYSEEELDVEYDVFVAINAPNGNTPLIRALLEKLTEEQSKRALIGVVQSYRRNLRRQPTYYEPKEMAVRYMRKIFLKMAGPLLSTSLPPPSLLNRLNALPATQETLGTTNANVLESFHLLLLTVHLMQDQNFFMEALRDFIVEHAATDRLAMAPLLAMLTADKLRRLDVLLPGGFVRPYKRLTTFCRMLAMNPRIWHRGLRANYVAPIVWRFVVRRGRRVTRSDVLEPDHILGKPNKQYGSLFAEPMATEIALALYTAALDDVSAAVREEQREHNERVARMRAKGVARVFVIRTLMSLRLKALFESFRNTIETQYSESFPKLNKNPPLPTVDTFIDGLLREAYELLASRPLSDFFKETTTTGSNESTP